MVTFEEFEKEIDSLGIEKRDYQLQAVKEIIKDINDKSILLNYPYGTGKTVIALLTFFALKKISKGRKFIFTSAREAAALRCKQALEMGKKFGFIDKLGYLYDPRGKGLGLRQKILMYEEANVIFSPITTLMNDRFQIKNKYKKDIFEFVDMIVIDEATDILARDLTGFRLSKYFQELFTVRKQTRKIPILGMTGTRDQYRAKAILKQMGDPNLWMHRPELSPYETISQIKPIKRDDYIRIDQIISTHLTKPVQTIQGILDSKLSRLEIMKLSYGGIVDRLRNASSFPIKISKYKVENDKGRRELLTAFALIFKLSHSRLLLLESSPGEFLRYVKEDESLKGYEDLQKATMALISHRDELPRYDKPEEKTTRGLVHPKVVAALELIHEHIIRGAKILLFTRYVALGEMTGNLLKSLKFPGVKFVSGKTPEDTRNIIIKQFLEEDINILIFTPVGGRGLNLEAADVVIHLDITTNVDDMIQRRERARGCMEYVLVLSETSEEGKAKTYAKHIGLEKGEEEE